MVWTMQRKQAFADNVSHSKPNREETWQPTLLGVSKHSLLREVLGVFFKSKTFNRLASDTNDILRKISSDS